MNVVHVGPRFLLDLLHGSRLALNIFFSVAPVEALAGRPSARVECDSIKMRMPHFCATLIHGSIRLAAATLPSRTASSASASSRRWCASRASGSRKPSIIFRRGEVRAVFGVTAIGLVLQHLGS
jgi:hypothetical protein